MSRARSLGVSVALASLALACAEAPASVVLSPQAEQGREVFLRHSSPACGTCHRLKDARTGGVTGPDLDEVAPDFDRVVSAVTGGIELMPAQGSILTQQQIEAVATYVVEAANGSAPNLTEHARERAAGGTRAPGG